ncbi:MAG: putative metal-binding motif-containing protein, partial [Myxococcota bacterium]|nr:putative metal-binding motif-containing protein [Myxococcota bacterium]
MRCRAVTSWVIPALGLVLVLGAASSAHAYGRGIDVMDCGGCHGGAGREPMVRITSIPAMPAPGSTVTLRVEVETVNGSAAGFHLSSSGEGSFRTISGEGTRLIGEDVVVHSTPGSSAGDWVSFDVSWLAPAAPGAVQLRVAAISANGDGASRGDGAGRGRLSVVYGCEGVAYYGDLDGDGHGAASRGSILACEATAGYSTSDGDCNDNDERIHPGADEACNERDDDCDDLVDEGLESALTYPDGDGDGYGGRSGDPIMGCGRPGYGFGRGDCDDMDDAIHPGATETCNSRDDDCDARIDERVRPVCGVGWCARAALGCDLTFCEPGEPAVETCNAFDDDCDGVADNGANLCARGESCYEGRCVDDGSAFDGGSSRIDGGTA